VKPRLYIDTSAYLGSLLDEAGAAAITARLRGSRMYSSVLLVLEATRNLVRLAREGRLERARLPHLLDRVRDDARRFTLRDLTTDLCLDVAFPALRTPRSLDLVHLRTALWFHRQDPLDGYLTNDASQRESARELGLPVG
jgi:hypothetical protein